MAYVGLTTTWLGLACGSCGGPKESSGNSMSVSGTPNDVGVPPSSGAMAASGTVMSSGTETSSGTSPASDAGGTIAPVSCSLDIEAGAPLQADPGVTPLPNYATPYVRTFTVPPTQVDTVETTDAPLLGNGDLGEATIGGLAAMP